MLELNQVVENIRDKSLCIPNLRNMLYQAPLCGRVLATYY